MTSFVSPEDLEPKSWQLDLNQNSEFRFDMGTKWLDNKTPVSFLLKAVEGGALNFKAYSSRPNKPGRMIHRPDFDVDGTLFNSETQLYMHNRTREEIEAGIQRDYLVREEYDVMHPLLGKIGVKTILERQTGEFAKATLWNIPQLSGAIALAPNFERPNLIVA